MTSVVLDCAKTIFRGGELWRDEMVDQYHFGSRVAGVLVRSPAAPRIRMVRAGGVSTQAGKRKLLDIHGLPRLRVQGA